MARAIDREHEGPLDLRDPLKEVLGLAPKHGDRRQCKERVDRNRDGEDPDPWVDQQPVLQRQEKVERSGDRIVISGPRWRERQELAQAPERNQREEHDRRGRARQEHHREHGHDVPPAADTVVEIDHGRRRACARGQRSTRERRDGQEAVDEGEDHRHGVLQGLKHRPSPDGDVVPVR
jgi:hypothetical protein